MSSSGQLPIRIIKSLRTKKRKALLERIGSADIILTPSLSIPDGVEADYLFNVISPMINDVQRLDSELLRQPDFPEDAVDDEVESAEDFLQPMHELLARLSTIRQRSQLSNSEPHQPSAYSTPLNKHVHFRTGELPPAASNLSEQEEIHQRSSASGRDCVPSTSASIAKELDLSPEIFDGDRLRFQHFRTQFRCYIERYPRISDREKLMVLVKCLAGDPKTLVDPLTLTGDNYHVAWKLLESNFSRQDVERDRLLAEIRHLKRIEYPYDVAGLRHLLNTVQRDVQVLENLGISLPTIAPTLKSSIDAALPVQLRQEFRDRQRAKHLLQKQLAALSPAAPPPPSPSGSTAATNYDDVSDRTTADDVVGSLAEECRELIDFLKIRAADLEDSKHLDAVLHSGGSGRAGARVHRETSKNNFNRSLPSTMCPIVDKSKAKLQPSRLAPLPCLFCETTDHNSSKCSASISVKRRRDILRQKNRCFNCFRSKHASANECPGPKGQCRTCGSRRHYTSMHPDQSSTTQSSTPEPETAAATTLTDGETLLMTAEAYITNGGTRIPVRVFLDTGSTLSFISPSVRRLLKGGPVQRAKLNILAFTSEHTLEADRFNIRLSPLKGGPSIEILAYEHEFSAHPSNRCSPQLISALKKFNENNPLADRHLLDATKPPPPSLLIGADYLNKLFDIHAPKCVNDDIRAYKTPFGWVIQGQTGTTPATQARVLSVTAACCTASLTAATTESIENLWRLDTIGVTEQSSEDSLSADEQSAIDQFKAGLSYDGKSYSVVLPKRPTISQLRNNRCVALNRLNKKVHQLKRDPQVYERYDKEITKFVDQGHAIEVPSTSSAGANDPDGTYHMPHHAVVTETSTGQKWRIVFDCSSKADGATSLNEHLLPGPNLNSDLVTLLINFRIGRVAFSADISQAYMRIAISPEERRLFRFFWQKPGETHVRCFQMVKLTWGAVPSSFVLAAVLREHFKKFDMTPPDNMASYLYVDDFLRSFCDDHAAIECIDRLRQLLDAANMKLAKWKANSSTITEHLASIGVEPETINLDDGKTLKILGIVWSPNEDIFKFSISQLADMAESEGSATKRFILRVVASIFDPLGWMLPFTIRGRLLIQKIWSVPISWDQEVSRQLKDEFIAWTTEFRDFGEFQFSRPYTNKPVTSYELHVFGDASTTAYACAAYIQGHHPDATSSTALIMSKARLAPRGQQSLPRLELLAALIAVRLKEFLVTNTKVEFERISLYTDSQITYFWATSETPGRWKTFVANRVSEIQNKSARDQWFLVPGDRNVSDLATRGIRAAALVCSSQWWIGPDWLNLPPPSRPVTQPRFNSVAIEPVQKEIRHTVAAVIATTPVIDLDRYSTLGRATRVTANVFKFARLARRQPYPGAIEMAKEAERHLIRSVQRQHFGPELQAIAAGDRVCGNSKLSGFNLFIDEEGILRAISRLSQSPALNYDEKHPVVIPGASRLAFLLIVDVHRVNAHFGVSTVLAHIRRRFLITRGRQIISSILRRCVICRRRQGGRYGQIEAPLPPERSMFHSPFETTGIDFCGPFFTRAKEAKEKTYILLFTCAAIRAVHLEATRTMSTADTLLAIRRFLATYPSCSQLISDNGRSFVRAATDIKHFFNMINNKEVKELLSSRQVEWRFICPRAPHHGGFYERMIGTVKGALVKTLGHSFITFDEFRTIIRELAAVVNDRPITHTASDTESPLAITPAQFLHGGPNRPSLVSITPLDRLGPRGASTAEELRKRLIERTTYFRQLSNRWYREDLIQLRSANQTRGRPHEPLKTGDVCLVKEDNAPRIRWPLVMIEGHHKGRDGCVRTYDVRFANGTRTRRAAQLLYPLELETTPTGDKEEN